MKCLRVIAIMAGLLLFLPQAAAHVFYPEVTDLEVCDIEYDYVMSYWSDGRPDTEGTLRFTVKLSKPTERVMLQRSRSNMTEDDHLTLGAYTPMSNPNNSTELTCEVTSVRSGTFFRLYTMDENNNSRWSPIYYTNSYIDPEDLAVIKGFSDIDEVTEAPAESVSINGRSIMIDTRQAMTLTVHAMDGRRLLCQTVNAPAEISLSSLPPGAYILKYQSDNTYKTIKFILK